MKIKVPHLLILLAAMVVALLALSFSDDEDSWHIPPWSEGDTVRRTTFYEDDGSSDDIMMRLDPAGKAVDRFGREVDAHRWSYIRWSDTSTATWRSSPTLHAVHERLFVAAGSPVEPTMHRTIEMTGPSDPVLFQGLTFKDGERFSREATTTQVGFDCLAKVDTSLVLECEHEPSLPSVWSDLRNRDHANVYLLRYTDPDVAYPASIAVSAILHDGLVEPRTDIRYRLLSEGDKDTRLGSTGAAFDHRVDAWPTDPSSVDLRMGNSSLGETVTKAMDDPDVSSFLASHTDAFLADVRYLTAKESTSGRITEGWNLTWYSPEASTGHAFVHIIQDVDASPLDGLLPEDERAHRFASWRPGPFRVEPVDGTKGPILAAVVPEDAKRSFQHMSTLTDIVGARFTYFNLGAYMNPTLENEVHGSQDRPGWAWSTGDLEYWAKVPEGWSTVSLETSWMDASSGEWYDVYGPR